MGNAFAARMHAALHGKHKVVELLSEGKETETFWLSLGAGKPEDRAYAREAPGEVPDAPAAFAVSREPRLYAVSDAGGAFGFLAGPPPPPAQPYSISHR